MPEELKRAQAAAAAATATNGAAGQGQKATGGAAPQLVKVPVAQSLSPARTSTPAQKSPLVMPYSAYRVPCKQQQLRACCILGQLVQGRPAVKEVLPCIGIAAADAAT